MALSDLLQGCCDKSDTVMIQQQCYKVDNKSDNINKVVTSC